MLITKTQIVHFLLSITAVFCQCPADKEGFFPDPEQCDKYYECADGVAKEHLCDDGLVFNTYSRRHARCDLPFDVDCSSRPKLQPPQPVGDCPRKWGVFPVQERCGDFVRCVDGKSHPTACPDGLIFNTETGNCDWPDRVKTKCSAKVLLDESTSEEDLYEYLGFTCPDPRKEGARKLFQVPRHPHPTDCRQFFICIDGRLPRRLACQEGLVFNTETSLCDEPKNVPDCVNYYED